MISAKPNAVSLRNLEIWLPSVVSANRSKNASRFSHIAHLLTPAVFAVGAARGLRRRTVRPRQAEDEQGVTRSALEPVSATEGEESGVHRQIGAAGNCTRGINGAAVAGSTVAIREFGRGVAGP